MTMNTVWVVGHLVRDVERKVTPSGAVVATFTAATNHRYQNGGGEWKEEAAFIAGVAFGRVADALSGQRKGTMVVLEGRLRTESWESDGANRSRMVLVAERAEAVQRIQPQHNSLNNGGRETANGVSSAGGNAASDSPNSGSTYYDAFAGFRSLDQPAPSLPVVSPTGSNGVHGKPAGSFRVLHTADWHLGKMLGEHSREEEHQHFLSFLLDQIRQLSVDALVIAGDVFDSANPAQSAAAQYYDFLSALYRQGGCSVVIVAGNHDSPAHLEAPRQVLKALGAHVLGALPASRVDLLVALPSPELPQLVVAAVPFLRDRDLRVGQSGQSATEIQRELVQGITRRYKEAAEVADSWVKKGIAVLATGQARPLGADLLALPWGWMAAG